MLYLTTPAVVVTAFVPSHTTTTTNRRQHDTTSTTRHWATTRPKDKRNLSRAQIEYYKLHQELKNLKKSNRRTGAQLAEQRLDLAVLECQENQEQDLQITDVTFNIVIMGYAHQSRLDVTAPMRAEGLLQKMKSTTTTTLNIKPTAFTYNAVMQAWSNSRLGIRAYNAILRLLQEMQEKGFEPTTFTYNLLIASNLAKAEEWYQVMLQGDENNLVVADRQTYHLLFKSYGQAGDVQKAESLVEELTERATKGEEELRPHNVWINCVISALSKNATPKSGDRADWWLTKMQKLYQLGQQTNMRPDASTFSQVMNVHATLGNTKRVEELLQDLEHRFVATGEPQLQPDCVSYTTAIKAYAKQPEQGSRLLRVMQDLDMAGRLNVAPNIVTYNTVIRSWASTATRDGLTTARQILDTMTVSPNSATYAELIFGWSASGLREAGYRAQELLQELEELPPSKQKGVELIKLYNAVILAWGRASTDKAPQRAEELLTILELKYTNGDWKACPNIVTFVSVADAYAKACLPDAQERCEVLLQRMDAIYKTGVFELKPNRVLYNTMLNALAKSCQPAAIIKAEEILAVMQDSEDCRPDIVTYATLIDCYTKCSSGDSSDRAEEILRLVEESYAAGNELLQPNAVFYSATLQAYAKTATPQGAQKAEALLRRNERLYYAGSNNNSNDASTNEHCKPHAILFNAVIDAVARSGLPDSGQHAEALLQEMEDKYQAGDDSFRVTRRSLNAVLLAYRNDVHGGQKAEYILRRMEELTEAGVYDVMPDVIAWNTAIGAIAHSDDPTAAERAQAMLDRMQDLYSIKGSNSNNNTNNEQHRLLRPDGITYSYVIEAWLKRNDEKGTVMANKLLDKFFTMVKSDDSLADPVWDVINTYRDDDDDDLLFLEDQQSSSSSDSSTTDSA